MARVWRVQARSKQYELLNCLAIIVIQNPKFKLPRWRPTPWFRLRGNRVPPGYNQNTPTHQSPPPGLREFPSRQLLILHIHDSSRAGQGAEFQCTTKVSAPPDAGRQSSRGRRSECVRVFDAWELDFWFLVWSIDSAFGWVEVSEWAMCERKLLYCVDHWG